MLSLVGVSDRQDKLVAGKFAVQLSVGQRPGVVLKSVKLRNPFIDNAADLLFDAFIVSVGGTFDAVAQNLEGMPKA